MKFVGIRHGLELRPIDEEGRLAIQSLRLHDQVMVELKQSRSLQQHRLYWGLIRLVHQNLPEELEQNFPRPENLSKAVLDALGYVDEVYGLDGRTFRQVRSIAFQNMDSAEFNNLMQSAIELVTTKIIPGLGCEELLTEINSIIGN